MIAPDVLQIIANTILQKSVINDFSIDLVRGYAYTAIES